MVFIHLRVLLYLFSHPEAPVTWSLSYISLLVLSYVNFRPEVLFPYIVKPSETLTYFPILIRVQVGHSLIGLCRSAIHCYLGTYILYHLWFLAFVNACVIFSVQVNQTWANTAENAFSSDTLLSYNVHICISRY